LSRLGVTKSAEGIKATENVGVALLLVPLALVRSQSTLTTFGQAWSYFPAGSILPVRQKPTKCYKQNVLSKKRSGKLPAESFLPSFSVEQLVAC
jgi:hypothetical protein